MWCYMSPMQKKRIGLLSKILITSMFLSGCSHSTHYAPVTDTRQPPPNKVSYHTVSRGETLYSIAWRYNLDYRKLAAANGIPSNFTIYPGQKLHLVESVTKRVKPRKKVPKLVKESPILTKKSAPRSKNKTPKIINESKPKNLSKPSAWVWPVKGKLSASFASNKGLNKGIDIKGELGEPVVAAASGVVVYSGDGLRGYGKLVIVKHSDKYLSAYAHNRRLLVREGDSVKIGQKIAEVGSSGTDVVKLHFEIRFDGKPVNPLKYLPKR